jgi:aspartate aminotransferase
MKISRRGHLMPPSPIRYLTPFADSARRRGVRVLHLNIGQPDIPTPAPLRARLRTIDDEVLAYTPSQGTDDYRASIVRDYERIGVTIRKDQVFGTTGGSEALLFAMMAVADPDDEGIVVEPLYANYRSFAMMGGIRLVPLTARGEDGFHLPPVERWEAAVSEKTRFVLLCNPNNPTGTVYTREEIERVAAFCRRHRLFLIVDEVYRDFVYDGLKAVSALTLAGYEEMVIAVDSLSKRFSACGIRLGWLATRNDELAQAVLRMAQGRLSAPGLAQYIAPATVDLDASYFEANRREYEERRNILHEGLTSIPGVLLEKPEGAFYVVARLPIDDSENFARWLLSDFSHEGTTVMVAPATGFYVTEGAGRDEIRIAYVLKASDLKLAVDVLRHAIPAYQQAMRDVQPDAPVAAGP